MRSTPPTPTDVLVWLHLRHARSLRERYPKVTDATWKALMLTLESKGWTQPARAPEQLRLTDAGMRNAARIAARRDRAMLAEERERALREPVDLALIRKRYARDGRVLRLAVELEAHREHVCVPARRVPSPRLESRAGPAALRFHGTANYRLGPCVRCGCLSSQHDGPGGRCQVNRGGSVICNCPGYVADPGEARHRELLDFVSAVARLADRFGVAVDPVALSALVHDPSVLERGSRAVRDAEQVAVIEGDVR